MTNFDLVPGRKREIVFVGELFVGGVRRDSRGVKVRVPKVTQRLRACADVQYWLAIW